MGKRVFLLLLIGTLYSGCASDCPHVEPCFSYMPHYAEIQLVDGATNEALKGEDLSNAVKMPEVNYDGDTGVCTFYVGTDDSIDVNIELEGYQPFSQSYDVERQADAFTDGCKVTGCVLSTNIPSTIELQPVE